jgi:hypothetical protein
MIPILTGNNASHFTFLTPTVPTRPNRAAAIVSDAIAVRWRRRFPASYHHRSSSFLLYLPLTVATMDVHAPINPTDLFSAKGLVVVITGGGSGTSFKLRATPPCPAS